MADRTSAGLFGMFFEFLAQNPTNENKEMAQKIYKQSGSYDFSNYQMYADDACIALGVARMGIDPRYPDEGEQVLWLGDPGYTKAK